MAFSSTSGEIRYYLDIETGKVITITNEDRLTLEVFYEESGFGQEDDQGLDFEEFLQQSDLHNWQQEAIKAAKQVDEGFGVRYIAVPECDSSESYRDMEDFVDTVQPGRLQNRLWDALRGQKPFRHFRDVLYNHPQERVRWFEFQRERVRQRVLNWLESRGIEPILD